MKETEFGDVFCLLLICRHQRKYPAFPDRIFLLITDDTKIARESSGYDMAFPVSHVADHNNHILYLSQKTHLGQNLRQRCGTVGPVFRPEQFVKRLSIPRIMVISDHCILQFSLLTLQS